MDGVQIRRDFGEFDAPIAWDTGSSRIGSVSSMTRAAALTGTAQVEPENTSRAHALIHSIGVWFVQGSESGLASGDVFEQSRRANTESQTLAKSQGTENSTLGPCCPASPSGDHLFNNLAVALHARPINGSTASTNRTFFLPETSISPLLTKPIDTRF